ncbi:hypothetical protein K2Y11_16670 [bacterium]|nr:hypothetical protein [bacterium]
MRHEEYSALKKKIQDEYAERMKALDLVWEMSKEINPSSSVSISPSNAAPMTPHEVTDSSEDESSIAGDLREIISGFQGNFRSKEAYVLLRRKRGPVKENTFYSAFQKLRKSGAITVVVKKIGSKPAVFRSNMHQEGGAIENN